MALIRLFSGRTYRTHLYSHLLALGGWQTWLTHRAQLCQWLLNDAYLDGAQLGTVLDDCLDHCAGHNYGNAGIFRISREITSKYGDCFFVKEGFNLERENQKFVSLGDKAKVKAFGGLAAKVRGEVAWRMLHWGAHGREWQLTSWLCWVTLRGVVGLW